MKVKVLLLIFLSLSLSAQEYAVVSNITVCKLSPKQIKAIFLKKLTHLDGIHFVPVNLPSSSKIRGEFEKKVLKIGKKRLKSYWVKQHYLGKRPPVIMKSQKSAIKFTQNVLGALTYVKAENIDSRLNVLYRWRDK